MKALAAWLLLVHSWYPQECCGGNECHPVPCDELVETKDGVRWRDLTFPSAKVRATQDNQCHVCDTTGLDHKHRGYCVFVQPSS